MCPSSAVYLQEPSGIVYRTERVRVPIVWGRGGLPVILQQVNGSAARRDVVYHLSSRIVWVPRHDLALGK